MASKPMAIKIMLLSGGRLGRFRSSSDSCATIYEILWHPVAELGALEAI